MSHQRYNSENFPHLTPINKEEPAQEAFSQRAEEKHRTCTPSMPAKKGQKTPVTPPVTINGKNCATPSNYKATLRSSPDGSKPYVLFIADGDGVIPLASYIQQGCAGGKMTAQYLYETIMHTLQDPNIEIRVIFFFNLEDLSYTMYKAGEITSKDLLGKFFNDFQNQGLGYNFKVVDVGWGKDKADNMIKAQIAIDLEDPTCQHLFLAFPHDGGYYSTLKMLESRNWKPYSTMIETVPILHHLSKLGYNVLKLSPILFRDEKIIVPELPPKDKPNTKTNHNSSVRRPTIHQSSIACAPNSGNAQTFARRAHDLLEYAYTGTTRIQLPKTREQRDKFSADSLL